MTNPILDFFGFSYLPFSKILSTRQIFPSTAYKEAFAQLEYGIPVEDIMLLSGPVGCGKSVVLNAVIQALDTNHYIPIYVRGNNLTEVELYKNILCGLDHQPPYFSGAAKRLFYRVVPELSKQPTIFIDDAQEMKDSALLALKSMVNFGSDSQHRITFVLWPTRAQSDPQALPFPRPQTAYPPVLPYERHEPSGNLRLHRPPHH